jgi:hypothetical protein
MTVLRNPHPPKRTHPDFDQNTEMGRARLAKLHRDLNLVVDTALKTRPSGGFFCIRFRP